MNDNETALLIAHIMWAKDRALIELGVLATYSTLSLPRRMRVAEIGKFLAMPDGLTSTLKAAKKLNLLLDEEIHVIK